MSDSVSYLLGQRTCQLKIGDSVRLLRAAQIGEKGWHGVWTTVHDTFINKIGEIRLFLYRGENNGVLVIFDECPSKMCVPYFILEKVVDREK